MKFNSVEEIKVWRESIELVKSLNDEILNNPKFKNKYSFIDQIQRASISVPSNIAEGHERETNNEFIRYLFIAKGSCGELRTQIYIAKEIGYISDEIYKKLNEKCFTVSKMLMGLIKSIRTNSYIK